ncbi:MAG: hypothetical protein ACOH1Y_11250 [Propionicimonas sp.]
MLKKTSLRLLTCAALGGALAFATTVPANAFSSSSTMTSGGLTYKASATSCNLYWSACSWSATGSLSASRSYTHTADVKANGVSISITISADPSATISGNSTTMAHAVEKGYGTYNSDSGVAHPSIFSVSVAARSKMAVGSTYTQTGWTTW